MLRSQGRFSDARDLDTYVLERQREVLGPDHPHALITANGLGADLRALGEFQEALALGPGRPTRASRSSSARTTRGR